MFSELANKLNQEVTNGLSGTYDKVALDKNVILQSARQQYRLDVPTWNDYQNNAPSKIMEEIADGYIMGCKLKVSGLGTAFGLGGLVTAVPDALQFLYFTLKMVTEIAAAYGFDPNPNYLEGKVKCIVLQSYLNGNIGHSAIDGAEKIGISAVTKFLKNVAMRKNILIKIIVAIGKVLGIRVTRSLLLKAVPVIACAAGGGLNWWLAQKIANNAKSEFGSFRQDLRAGKYKHDSDYDGLGN